MTIRLAQFITASSKQIISEWEEFARIDVASAHRLDLVQRRDHVEGMLLSIARDLETPQTKNEQANKSKGRDDANVASDTAANAHGTDRAAIGFSPVDVISEFRALRASVLRLWAEAQRDFSREHLDEVTRFNEAIDQLLVESMTRYAADVERSKDLFLGVVGHDLRNPLGAIMMSATVMMTQEGPDWAHSKTAARILNAGTRMDGLISDLVDFASTRLGAGISIIRSAIDLKTLCRQTIDEVTAFHPRCQVELVTTGDLHGDWDGGRIGQLLSNLVGNAFQHGAQGTPIRVTLTGKVDRVVLTVHNQGPRIPQSSLSDIFSPFKQLDPDGGSKHVRSVGLGLFIVKAIATAHEGTIEVDSSAENGTTFMVCLPRAAGTAPA